GFLEAAGTWFGGADFVVREDMLGIEGNRMTRRDLRDQFCAGIFLRVSPGIFALAFVLDADGVEIRIDVWEAENEWRGGIDDGAGVKRGVVFGNVLVDLAVHSDSVVRGDRCLRVVEP